jgi:hypothetical protein
MLFHAKVLFMTIFYLPNIIYSTDSVYQRIAGKKREKKNKRRFLPLSHSVIKIQHISLKDQHKLTLLHH